MRAFFEQANLAVTAMGVAIAVCNCFFGYRLRKLWVALIGFCVGGLLGFAVSMLMKQDAGVSTLIGVTVGAVAALLAFKLYLCGIFLLCGGLFFLLGIILIPTELSAFVYAMLMLCCVALSILVGVIAVKAVRPAVMAVTALTGGCTAVSGLFLLFHAENNTSATVLGVLLGVGGLVFQFLDEKRRQKMRQAADAPESPDFTAQNAAVAAAVAGSGAAFADDGVNGAASGFFAPEDAKMREMPADDAILVDVQAQEATNLDTAASD